MSRGEPQRENNDRIKRLKIARGSFTDRLNIKKRNEGEEPFSMSEDEFVESAKEEEKDENNDRPTFDLISDKVSSPSQKRVFDHTQKEINETSDHLKMPNDHNSVTSEDSLRVPHEEDSISM